MLILNYFKVVFMHIFNYRVFIAYIQIIVEVQHIDDTTACIFRIEKN